MSKILLPISKENLEILYYLWVLNSIALFSFASSLIYLLFLSLIARRKYLKTNDDIYLKAITFFSDLWGKYRNYIFGLAIVPALASLLFYGTFTGLFESNDIIFFAIGFVLYVIGLAFAVIFYNKFKIWRELKNIDISGSEELKYIFSENEISYPRYLRRAFAFLILSYLIYASMFAFAYQTTGAIANKSFFSILFSFQNIAIIFLALFVALAFGSSASLLSLTYRKAKISDELFSIIRKYSFATMIMSLILISFFIIANVVFINKRQLSNQTVFWSFVALFSVFFAFIYLYAYWKENKPLFAVLNFTAIAAALLSFASVNILSFKDWNKETDLAYARMFSEAKKELSAQLGIGAVKISGEDIYKAKCVACHAFDKVIVGPAYKDVLPKYGDDLSRLASFILNPQKINPQFPPMPNQGLKPSEAKAVAEFLIQKYVKQ